MAITAGGVGSGLDVEGIVSQLMYLERQPVRNLESKTKELQTQLSAFGKVQSALSTFESAMSNLGSLDKFKIFSSVSSDVSVLTATATSSAASGIYNIVVNRLAQNHKLGSVELGAADTFTGNLNIEINGSAMDFDATGMTLTQIRNKINSDQTNPGVTATIINTGTDLQRLVLTSEESGQANAMTVTGTASASLGFGMLNTSSGGGAITIAELDAEFTIDGINPPIKSASNTVSSVIDGITFELEGVGSSVLDLEIDKEAITESIQAFVDAYNELWSTLGTLEKGDLAGDSSVRSLKNIIRDVYNSQATGLTGSFTALINIGINSDAKTGKLSLDSSDLADAINSDLNSVAELFADGSQGFASRLEKIADTLGKNDGFIYSRQESLRSSIRYNENQVDSWEARLELREKAMRAKFAQLDSLIGSMQSTSAFLANNLY